MSYKQDFLDLAIKDQALKFGDYTLKSGRKSPYFFNAAAFSSGSSLAVLGRCYAQALVASTQPVDMLFGAAYKGIPLVTATAIALSELQNTPVPFGFNRKEAKAHGEGGQLVGPEPSGSLVIVDDLITAGTAIREVIDLLDRNNISQLSVLIGLDRMERGQGQESAIRELEQQYDLRVISIASLDDVMHFAKDVAGEQVQQQIAEYRKTYAAN